MDRLFDWLSREGGMVLSWWLLATLAGAAAWPLSFRLLRGLPDRGYTLVRALGLIVIGYVFWIAANLGLLENTGGSVILAAVVVLALGLIVRRRDSMLAWFRANWKLVLVTEALFVVMLFGWALYRAHYPDMTSTEKPMEMAFMSAIRRSETFPPNDPWMSGYAISYYHFGYVIAGALAKLSGVTNGAAFSLMIALLFALTGIGAFGVVYNLVQTRIIKRKREDHEEVKEPRPAALLSGILGLVFVTMLGNFYTLLLEIPYQTQLASPGYLSFLDVEDRDAYPETFTPAEDQTDWNTWWWFRASRVVRDRDLNGAPSGIQPIDEFPAFSFVLGDMHPHVLALPFAMLALGLALNLLLHEEGPAREQLLLYGVCLGGLTFLNTWDGPIYIAVMVGAEALRRLIANGRLRITNWWERARRAWMAQFSKAETRVESAQGQVEDDWLALIRLGLLLAAMTLIFYAPFFIGFRSQAGGILPNVIHPTRFQQFFLMFGPFVLILLLYLRVQAWQHRGAMNWRLSWRVIGFGLLGIVLALLALGLIAWLRADVRSAVYSVVDNSGGLFAVFGQIVWLRLAGIPVLLLLGAIIATVIARLFVRAPAERPDFPESPLPAVETKRNGGYSRSAGFALLLIGAGAVLALLPDYVYLRDNFGVRINTLFKFYYQAWLMWGVASAYAAYALLSDHRISGRLQGFFAAVLVLILISGLLYPVLAVRTRATVEAEAFGYAREQLSFDGGPWLGGVNDDYPAIACLNDLLDGDDAVVAEAVGPAYHREYGRVAGLTGIPNVLGWENHERQWRGDTYNAIAGTRAEDIATLYNTPNWPIAQEIIDRYGIDYIFVGTTERQTYDAIGLQKFGMNLTAVCGNGAATVYQTNSN